MSQGDMSLAGVMACVFTQEGKQTDGGGGSEDVHVAGKSSAVPLCAHSALPGRCLCFTVDRI